MDLAPRYDEQEIAEAVRRVARQIEADVADVNPDRPPLLVGILKGSFVFLADLIRELRVPTEVDFIRARSYGSEMRSAGAVEITKDIETDVAGRYVVVVEDILDTGLTMDVVVRRLEAGHPAVVRRCALLVREGSPLPDFYGLVCPPGFVVGYGIDVDEQHRGLRDIRVVAGTEDPAEP